MFCPGKGWNCEHACKRRAWEPLQAIAHRLHAWLLAIKRSGKQVLYDFFPEGHDRRLQGYMHGVSGIFIQGMPCLSQLISHKVLSDVFLEHRNKNSYSNNAPCMYRTYLTYQNVFALTRFRYIVVLFHIFYHNWGKENRSLFWGLLEACFLGRIYTGEANLIKNKGEETLQCSLKWGKRTQGWTSMILKFINDSKLASGRNITNYNTMNEHDTERRVTNQNKLGGLQMSYIGLNNHWTWDSYDVTNTYKMSSI